MPQEHFQRVQKKIENLTVTELAQETMRSEIRRTTLEKTFEEQGTLNRAVRAWNIECLWCEIWERWPASIKQAMEMQAQAERDANMMRSCRVKETSRAKTIWHEEKQPDWDSVEQHSSVRDPGAHAQPKQKRTRE